MLYIQERENFTMYNNNIFPARAIKMIKWFKILENQDKTGQVKELKEIGQGTRVNKAPNLKYDTTSMNRACEIQRWSFVFRFQSTGLVTSYTLFLSLGWKLGYILPLNFV